MRFTRLLTLSAAAAIAVGSSIAPAGAQWVVSDPALLSATVAADTKNTSLFGMQISQQTTATLNIVKQVTQMIADHVPLSTILTQEAGPLAQTINKNNSLLSSDMQIDQKTLADFQQIAPQFKNGQTYLQYLALLKKNANTQYAQSLSMTSAQLQAEGGVGSAVAALTAAPATNELQALQTLVNIGGIQTKQMDSLIKIQSSMLKSMATFYATTNGGSGSSNTTAGTTPEAARQLCLSNVPGFESLTGAQRASALATCQSQLNAAQQTSSVSPSGS